MSEGVRNIYRSKFARPDTGTSLQYNPAFDGMRAVAVLMVILYHLEVPHAVGGLMGVHLFFGLSGFLITTLLLQHPNLGLRGLRDFYLRRALRLLPALLLMLAAYSLYSVVKYPPATLSSNIRALPPVLLYVGNWAVARRSGLYSLGDYIHLWSLAVEEQFYLLWPAIVVVALAARRGAYAIAAVAGLGSVGALGLRLVLWSPSGRNAGRLIYGTDTVADAILVGCLLSALTLALTAGSRKRLEAVARWALWPALLYLAVLLIRQLPPLVMISHRFAFAAATSAVALAVGAIVLHLHLARASWFSRILSLAPLVALGRISYGMYLWHVPVIDAVRRSGAAASGWVFWTTVLAGTVALAFASYLVVERPLRRWGAARLTTQR